MLIIHGSALEPAWSLLGYVLTGVVAFLMCLQAWQQWLNFVPGTFIGACATFAGDGEWRLVTLSLLVGLLFGFAMKNSGLWLAAREPGRGAGRLNGGRRLTGNARLAAIRLASAGNCCL